MSIHFAAARRTACSPVARALARRARGRAANDNGRTGALEGDALLGAALAQFSAHGLGAARDASLKAEAALRRDDETGFDHWHAICAALDRALADRLIARRRRIPSCA